MKPHTWTAEDDATLRQIYPGTKTADVAALMCIGLGAVYRRASRLGLKKSDAFKASDLLARVKRGKQNPAIRAVQIKPGDVPWNKGIKGSTGLHPNCKKTQFKKGGLAGAAQHNYVPIGSLRITKDGALNRKVTDDPSVYPARRWVSVARLVWQAKHGDIPAGHIVVFKHGKATNSEHEITADRLECITRVENLRRNSIHSKTPELAALYQLKGAISRQVNRISKESQNDHAPH